MFVFYSLSGLADLSKSLSLAAFTIIYCFLFCGTFLSFLRLPVFLTLSAISVAEYQTQHTPATPHKHTAPTREPTTIPATEPASILSTFRGSASESQNF